jgi:rod shape determining protein RodA
MDLRSYLRHLDYSLLAVVAALLGYGVTVIFFATRNDIEAQPSYYSSLQLVYGAAGLAVMIALSLIDYERYRNWQWLLYTLVITSIAAVFLFGGVTRGSRRWIELPFFNFQPSELALVVLTVTLAAFLTDRLQELGLWRVTLLALAYVAVPAGLVFAQPDLGTTTVFVVLVLTALLFFGTPWKHFVAIGGGLLALAVVALKVLPMIGLSIVHQYQIERLLVFLDPGRDPQGVGYNVGQSMIAVGAGALRGRGEQATQTTLDFLPEHHTDFIFAVIGERYGFFGGALLLALFVLLIWRALRIATLSRDLYGSIIAGSIAAMFLFEVFVNVGMTIGIMPVTGIPLPFISYGGAALITNLMMIGLLQSIHLRSHTDPAGIGYGYR